MEFSINSFFEPFPKEQPVMVKKPNLSIHIVLYILQPSQTTNIEELSSSHKSYPPRF